MPFEKNKMRCPECDHDEMIAEEVEWYCPECGHTEPHELDFNDNDEDAFQDAWDMEFGEYT